jgi:hypothetical protein
MRILFQALFGVIVGLAAAGLVKLLELSPAMMFGVGMLYGSAAQLVAQKIFTDRSDAPTEYAPLAYGTTAESLGAAASTGSHTPAPNTPAPNTPDTPNTADSPDARGIRDVATARQVFEPSPLTDRAAY